jgi:hypothetical protein
MLSWSSLLTSLLFSSCGDIMVSVSLILLNRQYRQRQWGSLLTTPLVCGTFDHGRCVVSCDNFFWPIRWRARSRRNLMYVAYGATFRACESIASLLGIHNRPVCDLNPSIRPRRGVSGPLPTLLLPSSRSGVVGDRRKETALKISSQKVANQGSKITPLTVVFEVQSLVEEVSVKAVSPE